MNCLITGGAGFIGSHLAQALLDKGHKVLIVDNLFSGKKENVPKEASFYRRSVTESLSDIFGEIDCVFHFAAIPSILKCRNDPAGSNDVNVQASVKLLELCRKHDCRFVFSSSAAVYNSQETAVEDGPCQSPPPVSLYGFQKLIVERYASNFLELYGLHAVILRYFNVYGPRQSFDSANGAVMPSFINASIKGQPLVIYGDGKQTRDFVYVKDVTKANMLALECKPQPVPINIASGTSHSVLDAAEMIAELSPRPVKISHKPSLGGLTRSSAKIDRAKKTLGWKPDTDFAEGLRETYSYYSGKIPKNEN